MKKYRLKDHELQKKLEAIDPSFGELLNYNADLAFTLNDDLNFLIYVCFGEKSDLSFRCSSTDVELYDTYNTHDWNKYPEITPPYDVLMRVELDNGNGYKAFLHKFIEGDLWCFGNGKVMPKAMSDSVRHFRPWE